MRPGLHAVARTVSALSLICSGALIGGARSAAAETARMTATFVLRHTAYAPAATATARLTVVHKGLYHLQVAASHLPTPEALHVAPQRHAYLIWAYDGSSQHGTLRAVRLTLKRSTGSYSADGTVAMAHITELFVTADRAGGQTAPTVPEVSVLSTVGHLHA